MPRRKLGARLWLQPAYRRPDGHTEPAVWCIKDGRHKHSTGYGLADCRSADHPALQDALATYLGERTQPSRQSNRSADQVAVGDVIAIYLADKVDEHGAPQGDGAAVQTPCRMVGGQDACPGERCDLSSLCQGAWLNCISTGIGGSARGDQLSSQRGPVHRGCRGRTSRALAVAAALSDSQRGRAATVGSLPISGCPKRPRHRAALPTPLGALHPGGALYRNQIGRGVRSGPRAHRGERMDQSRYRSILPTRGRSAGNQEAPTANPATGSVACPYPPLEAQGALSQACRRMEWRSDRPDRQGVPARRSGRRT